MADTKLVQGAENIFLQFFGLNATPTIQPAEATTGINTRETTATIQTTSAGNLHQLH